MGIFVDVRIPWTKNIERATISEKAKFLKENNYTIKLKLNCVWRRATE